MVRVDYLVFGYRKISISPDKLSLVTSLLLRGSIPSTINSDGSISVRERDFLKFQKILQGRVEYEYSEILGLYGLWVKTPHKPAVLTALAISVVLTLFLSSVVWDVRVEGNSSVPDSKIVYELSECGFSVGDFWSKSDLSLLESDFLRQSKDISWININRRGTVAYVTVVEKEENDEDKAAEIFFSNIVASDDCVIEEITVKKGTAMVAKGDTVKKGDILIAGILSAEGEGGFCHAEGQIIGRVNETVSVEVDRKYEKKSYLGDKLYSCRLKLFDFSLNIFKLYGNLGEECDIIENEKSYSLFGKCKLPFSVALSYIPEYSADEGEFTDSQLVSLATDRLNALICTRLASCDLVKIRTYGDFTDNGYKMSSDIVFLCEVGAQLEFEVE